MTKRLDANIRRKVACTLITSMLVGASCGFVSADNGFDSAKYKNIGYVSMVGEVGINGHAGFISTGEGDAGGKSYGLSQFTSKGGGASANAFVKWLKKYYPEMGKNFEGVGKAGTESFDKAWKKTYEENKDTFGTVQMEYTGKNYVEPFVDKAKNEFGVDFYSTRALTEYAYSTTVQFGVNGAMQVARNAGINSSMSELEILEKCTEEKKASVGTYKFLGCSQSVRNSVYNRFTREYKEFKDIANGVADIKGEGVTTLDDLVNGSNGETLDDLINDKNTSNSGVLDDLINDEGSSNNGELDDLVSGEDSSNSGELDDLINGEDNSNNGELDDLINDENASNGELDNLVNGEESKEDIEDDSDVEKDDFENGSLDDLVNGDDSKEDNQDNSENEEGSLDDLVNNEEDSESSDNDYSNQDDADEKVENEESPDSSLDLDKEDTSEVKDDKDSSEVDSTEEKEEMVDITTEEIDEEKEPIEETLDDLIGESVQEDISKEEVGNEDKEVQENEVEEETEGDVSEDDLSKDVEENKAVNDAIEDSIEVEESEDIIAKLEKELENNIFGKLFKTTRDIMNNENGVDGVREIYMS